MTADVRVEVKEVGDIWIEAVYSFVSFASDEIMLKKRRRRRRRRRCKGAVDRKRMMGGGEEWGR